MKRMKKTNRKVMKTKKWENVKMIAAVIAVTGACAAISLGISDKVLAAEIGRSEKIPTVYTVYQKQSGEKNLASVNTEPTVKADYHIVDDANYPKQEKTGNELSKEEAAQIGAKYIEKLYDIKLDGTYFYMGYMPGTETFPRAFWAGDVRLNGNTKKPEDTAYFFMIDAVTGELFNSGYARQLKVSVPLGYDAALANNHNKYSDEAMKIVKDKGLLLKKAVKIEYDNQGYTNNDPSITFAVYGEDGERVNISLSRYDKSFKGLITQADFNITEQANRALEKRMEEMK